MTPRRSNDARCDYGESVSATQAVCTPTKEPVTRGDSAHHKSSMTKTIRRKSETVRLTNERDFPHLVELALPPEGFRGVSWQLMRSTVNDASQSVAAEVDTKSNTFIFDSASQTPPLRTHSAIASVASA
jgi:hypothetical protein